MNSIKKLFCCSADVNVPVKFNALRRALCHKDCQADGGREDVTIKHHVISTTSDSVAAVIQVTLDRDWNQ